MQCVRPYHTQYRKYNFGHNNVSELQKIGAKLCETIPLIVQVRQISIFYATFFFSILFLNKSGIYRLFFSRSQQRDLFLSSSETNQKKKFQQDHLFCLFNAIIIIFHFGQHLINISRNILERCTCKIALVIAIMSFACK